MKSTLLFSIAIAILATSCISVPDLTQEQKIRLLIGSGQKGDETDKSLQMMAAAQNEVPGSAAASYPVPEKGIPSIILADGPAGLRIAPHRKGTDSTFFCTGFPIGLSLASSWDNSLVEEVGAAMGNEVLEYGVDILLAPGMNLLRNPLCGRNFEYYSEDPVLSGRTAAGMVRGLQSNGIGACIKHFAANNQEINRCNSDSRVDERTLRELYFKNFEIAVKEGKPWTIMTSYNRLNGPYVCQNATLTEDLIRGEWGFDGLVMTDWGGGNNAAEAAIAGNDFIMPGNARTYSKIAEALQKGEFTEAQLNRNVRRVLDLLRKTPKWKGYKHTNSPDLKAHSEVARRAGAEGCVLLKNDDALPLKPGSKVALFGVSSYQTIAGGTGAGDVNKAYVRNLDYGMLEDGFELNPDICNMYAAHLKSESERLAEINAKRGWWFGEQLKDEPRLADVAVLVGKSAETSDAAVVCIGRRSGEGTDRNLDGDYLLKAEEKALLDCVKKAFGEKGKPMVVVLNVGGPVQISDWESDVDAILCAWQPGQEAGCSIADVLCGKVNPSGRLPMTLAGRYEDVPAQNFPLLNLEFNGKNNSFYHYRDSAVYEIKNVDYLDYEEGLLMGYRYFCSRGVATSRPFGFGLSYTTFNFSDFKVKSKGKNIEISVNVKNTGSRAGKETVEIFWSNPEIEGEPTLQLLCYAKTHNLEPGQTQTVKLSAGIDELAWYNPEEKRWIVQSGNYEILLCSDAEHRLESRTVRL